MTAPWHLLSADPWHRVGAVVRKELLQIRRDRITVLTSIMIPILQVVLFGYAVNVTPRNLPTAVLEQETSDVERSFLAALENTRFFKITHHPRSVSEMEHLLVSGNVLVGIEMPVGFERAVRRADHPALLATVDATDPVTVSAALTALGRLGESALLNDRAVPDACQASFEIRQQRRYNPAASTQLNFVPGLLGSLLTVILLIFSALTVPRERERGTMEGLLVMPFTPLEIMLGKIIPYVLIGFIQATLILGTGILLFEVPVAGPLWVLAGLTTLFIIATLAIGYIFSTVAQTQLQAGQMAMMFYLPNVMISGFIFPFTGMPAWAQWIGECLPLTHYLRIVRGIMLKGATYSDVQSDALMLLLLTLVATVIAISRFRRTLD